MVYSFYKNVTLYAINLWYAYFCGWSGTPLFDRWLIALYNVFFTSVPPGSIGVMDWPAPAHELLRYPARFYQDGQKNRLFNARVFWTWMLDALVHSVVVFVITAYLIAGSKVPFLSDGRMGDHITAGNFAYTSVLIIVSLRAALTLNCWHFLSFLGVVLGLIFWFAIALPVYSYLYPTFNLPDMSGQVGVLYTNPSFWLTAVVITPLAALSFDIFFTIAGRMLEMPDNWHDLIPGILASNRPPRPALPPEARRSPPWEGTLSTQPRSGSVTSLPTSTLPRRPGHERTLSDDLSRVTQRGYAFSQDETGVSTQADLLRIWGSNQPLPPDQIAEQPLQRTLSVRNATTPGESPYNWPSVE